MTEIKKSAQDSSHEIQGSTIINNGSKSINIFGVSLDQIVGLHEAKEVLQREFTLRAAIGNQPQRNILLEGLPGSGKTTLGCLTVRSYMEKYPGKFELFYIKTQDVTDFCGNTSRKVSTTMDKIRNCKKIPILFMDEIDELLSKKGERVIAVERTNAFIKEFDNEIPNLLVIGTTNNPKRMDEPCLDRFSRTECPMPTNEELKEIIEIHLNILNPEQKRILHESMIKSNLLWSGRDIKKFGDELRSLDQYNRLINPEYTTLDIFEQYKKLEWGILHRQDNYKKPEIITIERIQKKSKKGRKRNVQPTS